MKNILIIFGILFFYSAYAQMESKIDKLNVGNLKLPKEPVSKAVYINEDGQVKSSSVSDLELGYLSGLTDTIPNLLTSKANDSDVVKLTGDQSVEGVKTFTGKIVASSTANGSHPCPTMTDTQMLAIVSPSNGDCVHNSTLGNWLFYNSTSLSWETSSGGEVSNTFHPVIRPSLNLDFANTKQLDSRITFTRASTATRVNEFGLIESVAGGVPRFDHNPITGESLGLLIEEGRTNLFLRSEEFDDAAWTKTRSSIAPNVAIAPDGTMTADKLVEDTTAGSTHLIDTATSISFTNGTAYTISAFFKDSGRDFGRIGFTSSAFGATLSAFVTISTCTVGSFSSGVTAIATRYADGWCRLSASATATATATGSPFVSPAFSSSSSVYTGDGVSGIFIWGAQLEVGAFPTSYIPTVASSVTRSADNASMTGTNFSSWYRADEGTLVISTPPLLERVASATIAKISDGGTSNFMTLIKNAGDPNLYAASVTTLGTTVANINNGQTTSTGGTLALAYKLDDFSFTAKGATPATDTSGGIPIVSQLNLGATASNVFSVAIKRLTYYPKRLTNAELQAVTK
jgi:hypothetical protein